MTMMDRAMEATSASGPAGGGLADYFPLSELRNIRCQLVSNPSNTVKYVPPWMPGAKFMRTAMRGRELVRRAHYAPFEMVRKAVVRPEHFARN